MNDNLLSQISDIKEKDLRIRTARSLHKLLICEEKLNEIEAQQAQGLISSQETMETVNDIMLFFMTIINEVNDYRKWHNKEPIDFDI